MKRRTFALTSAALALAAGLALPAAAQDAIKIGEALMLRADTAGSTPLGRDSDPIASSIAVTAWSTSVP